MIQWREFRSTLDRCAEAGTGSPGCGCEGFNHELDFVPTNSFAFHSIRTLMFPALPKKKNLFFFLLPFIFSFIYLYFFLIFYLYFF